MVYPVCSDASCSGGECQFVVEQVKPVSKRLKRYKAIIETQKETIDGLRLQVSSKEDELTELRLEIIKLKAEKNKHGVSTQEPFTGIAETMEQRESSAIGEFVEDAIAEVEAKSAKRKKT